jgi:hypothetical protein
MHGYGLTLLADSQTRQQSSQLAYTRPLRTVLKKDRFGTKKNSWCFIEGIDNNDKLTIGFLKRGQKTVKLGADQIETLKIQLEEK